MRTYACPAGRVSDAKKQCYAGIRVNDLEHRRPWRAALIPCVLGNTDGKCGSISPLSTTAGKDDTLATFSNYGSVIDLAAPGVLIKTTAKGGSYTTFSGTSVSTPHVTGAAALYKSEHTGATPSQVRTALRNLGSTTSTICDGKGHGYFKGDRDSYHEPLLYLASSSSSVPASSFAKNIRTSPISSSGNDGNVPSNVLNYNLGNR